RAMIQQVVKGREIRQDMVAKDNDGNTTYLDLSMKAITDANNVPQMVIVESRDTTAYHLADAKRTEYEQRYQAIFDHTTDAVFILGMQGEFLSINKRAEEMLLIKMEDLSNYQVLDFVVPEEREQSSAQVDYLRSEERRVGKGSRS